MVFLKLTHMRPHPAVFIRVVMPEVLVGIDLDERRGHDENSISLGFPTPGGGSAGTRARRPRDEAQRTHERAERGPLDPQDRRLAPESGESEERFRLRASRRSALQGKCNAVSLSV